MPGVADLREAFASAAGPGFSVRAARLRYAPGNHVILEFDGVVSSTAGGEPFSIVSDPLHPSTKAVDEAVRLGAEMKAKHV